MSDVDIEDTVNKIKNHKSVQGIVIVNSEGAITRTTNLNQKKDEDNIQKSSQVIQLLSLFQFWHKDKIFSERFRPNQ